MLRCHSTKNQNLSMVMSHHVRQLSASRQRWLRHCRSTRHGIGRLCSQVGPTATSRLCRLNLGAVKYWQRKWNNPNFHAGENRR
jgi:hypothetical protein